MMGELVSKIQKVGLWHLVWISAIVSEALTALIVSVVSFLIHGEVRGDFLFTGAVTALLVSLAVLSIIVAFVERLRETEELNIQVMKSVGEGLAVYGEDGRIRFTNQYLCGIFGYAEGTLDGAPFSALVSERYRRRLTGLGEGGIVAEPLLGRRIEVEGARRDGQTFPMELRIERSISSGGTRMFTAAVRDITARKLSDERLQLLAVAMESVGDAVMITDAGGRIQYVNRTFTAMTGYTPLEVEGKDTSFLKSGAHPDEFYRRMWGTLTSGQPWRGKIINLKKGGAPAEYDMAIAPVAAGSGPLHYVSVMRDVTREEMFERSKHYFTAIASHELATPLTQLVLLDNLLSSPGFDPQEMRDSLKSAIADLRRIFTATSMLAALTVPGPDRQGEKTYIRFVLEGAVRECRKDTAEGGRQVAVELEQDAVSELVAVEGEKQLATAIVEEALSNAVKFTPDGGKVTVRANTDEKSVSVEILDEGEGIPEEITKDLSRPYFSTENTLSHSTGRYKYKGGGMGLGITIMRLAMERMGGSLDISRRPEGGTRILLVFPRAPEE